ncbi:MAG TPA: HAMP domain-containing sensor histidine kinase [Streptosporangiaceae bacterium]|nr:HAMP domain-containing sensor histidine kinase [Streptosporangiaceae bacterium]
MARRISLIVIALVVVLLGIVAVPLGLSTANQDRTDFKHQTATEAAAVATVAEEHLDDKQALIALRQEISELRRQGDQVAVFDKSGRWVAGNRSVAGVSRPLVNHALAGSTSFVWPSEEHLTVATPVLRDESTISLGAVVVSRPTGWLDHRLATLWAWLALVSVIALAASALTAAWLARWVSRPLAGLEATARQLGGGRLSARSAADAGPPEVRRLASNFNAMAGRLEALVGGHQAMMADVSHQLRTPLAALRLRLDVLGLQAPPPLADELAGAQDEIARLSRMVDGLLAVARAENVSSAQVLVQVDAVIRDRVAAWLPAAEERPVNLDVTVAEPVTIRAGDGHLEQVLDNLLANALEAVPAGGHIRVGAAPTGTMVRITVVDDGPGMTEQQRASALRRYVTATPGGTGLGLAIVHRLVTSDGGTIALSDTPGGGLTVTVDVPAAAPAARDRQAWRSGSTPGQTRDLKQADLKQL